MPRPLSDIELLDLEVPTIWPTDARGRNVSEVSGTPGLLVVVAAARGAHSLHPSSHLDDLLVEALQEELAGTTPAIDPSQKPEAVDACARLLELEVGPVEAAGGPSSVVPADFSFGAPGDIVTPASMSSCAREPPGESGWTPDEWRDLIEGRLGPWAMGIEQGAVIAICHCARLGERAVEAGVWTHPAYRGRGYASTVTAAWARQVVPTGRVAFYSTSADNLSSRRVAARLGLRQIGWTWKLRALSDIRPSTRSA